MTIASDFYDFLRTLGDGAVVASGSPGRKLHNRIAELEEAHARYAELQREHARLRGKYRSALRDIARDAEHAPELTGLERYKLDKFRKGSETLDDVAFKELRRRREAGEPAVTLDDITRAFEATK